MTRLEQNGKLSELEYSKLINAKDKRRAAIFKTMTRVSKALSYGGQTVDARIYEGWKNVNCYFPFATNPDILLYIGVNPVTDSKTKLSIVVKELDRKLWEEEMKLVSFGAENKSVLRTVLEPTIITNSSTGLIKFLKKDFFTPKEIN